MAIVIKLGGQRDGTLDLTSKAFDSILNLHANGKSVQEIAEIIFNQNSKGTKIETGRNDKAVDKNMNTKALVVASQSDNKAEILEQLKEALMFLDSSLPPTLSLKDFKHIRRNFPDSLRVDQLVHAIFTKEVY